jgi:hypothetical protein
MRYAGGSEGPLKESSKERSLKSEIYPSPETKEIQGDRPPDTVFNGNA